MLANDVNWRKLRPYGRGLLLNRYNLLVSSGVFCHNAFAHENDPPAILQPIQGYPQVGKFANLEFTRGCGEVRCQ